MDHLRATGRTLACVVLMMLACGPGSCETALDQARKRAAGYLAIEVPRWKKENGCYSCHNNGDAARALMAAGRRSELEDTLRWLANPVEWNQQQSDAPFRDKGLARIQFSLALAEAVERGLIADRAPLEQSARELVRLQNDDGSWTVEDEANVGSPATYGSPLATYAVLRVLKVANSKDFAEARERSGKWMSAGRSAATVDRAARVLSAGLQERGALGDRQQLEAAQNPDGGWGPYRASPSEVFDTAIALMALGRTGDGRALAKGRDYLLRTQLPGGGWPATTRPSGVASYAQQISTTGWALLALSQE
ncbi:MAG: terpene cyclase/mutase family protein [Bryobacterales bacterium]|nr:terpene cyclase/mutase family protein [Bryobacterales bacterium]